MTLRDYGLEVKNGELRFLSTGGRRKQMDDTSLAIHLNTIFHIPFSDVDKLMKQLKEEAKEIGDLQDKQDLNSLMFDTVSEYSPFKNFEWIVNIINRTNVIYYRNKEQTLVVCSYEAFDGTILKNILELYEPDLFDNLYKQLAKLISPKNWALISASQAMAVCFNSNNMRDTLKRIEVTSDPHPACIEGSEKFSLTTIPYATKTVSFCDMNPYLQDFLKRVEHHEYLCAILWSHFIGNLLPYVIYLRGDGGDGKTSFINMLGKLARSYANFDGGDRFNYFNMFGKSIIGLNENESSKLMQNRVLKTITGGNNVQIEGKGKNAITGQIRGLIVIDSNYDLELLNREDEKRRLRYFRVNALNRGIDSPIIAQDTFIELLGQTNNEFLNYCRVCYENLNIPDSGGLIQKTPNHDQIFTELTDNIQEHKFAEFYRYNIAKTHILEGKCESVDILLALEKKFPKDPYIQRNFKKYLETHYGIKPSGKYFIGLSKYDKELNNAMPKT